MMVRLSWTALAWLVAGLAAGRAEAAPPDAVETPAEETTQERALAEAELIRRTLVVLEEMTQAEREQLLPWLVNTISGQPDVHLESRLSEALEKKLAREQPLPAADEIGLTGEEAEGFQALLRRERQTPPSEEDIRRRIDAVATVFDPKQPEAALNQAVELAGAIERLEDPQLRAGLMRVLEDRLAALQAR